MATDFQFHYILCSTPPELEAEREEFEAAVARFVADVTIADGVLFAPASFRPPIVAANQKPLIESNIRMCEFIVPVFGEARPDPVFAGFAEYALGCCAEPGAKKRVCVFFRNFAAAAREARQFRERLAAGGACELRDYSGPADFAAQLDDLLRAWYAPLKKLAV